MIHVFLVDAGTTYLVDVDLQHPVSHLNAEIARLSLIPVEKQVLLVSGGVPLFPDKPLFHYEATLVDNPVYLICKTNIPNVTRPLSGSHSYSDRDLTSQVEASANMPAALETVRARTQLAQHICQIDRHELKSIEKLVFDQHLQQQGWAAVVANLEDLVSGFEKRANTFQRQFREFLKTREDILSLLRRMPDVLILLEKIPVLPCLESLASKTSVSLKGPLELLPSLCAGKLTLYIWMNSQDPKFRLEDVIRDLNTGTNQMGGELEERVSKEVQDVIKYASGPWPSEMKSIRGLEERLYGLDKLVQSAKTTMDGQDNMTKGFELNWGRLQKDVKDTSILPDLCTSHRSQMKEMLGNHKKLLELKKKCADAKKELSDNLKQRLTWVMETHHLVNDMDNKLMLYYDWLNRIKRRTEFLQQVEQSPKVYAAMVVEVVRRQLFSQHYLKWAKGVAEESRKEHKKEMHRRKSFTRQFGSHFLQKLFVGFRDNVPKFAAEAPKDVDSQLPEITPSDVHTLAENVPELRQQLRVPTGTGSPALASSLQQPLAADGGSDPLMIEVTQSLASSTASFITQSITSVTQSVSESVDTGQAHVLGPGERSRLSLSYQEGEGERQDSEMLTDDQLFLSLQDKFPVPQCLSETLTAEVNSAAMSTISATAMSASPKAQDLTSALEELGPQQQPQPQHPEGGGDGVLFSSGDLEPTKSSDSDAISHESLSERKPRTKRQTGKGLSDTSPDAETSQEFTTADFYIEDSMPSSITDSPPKPRDSGKDRGEMNAALAEKTKRVGELEGEVSALQAKLASQEEKLTSLQSMLNRDVVALRQNLAGIKECVRHSDGERVRVVSGAQEAVVGVCASLVASVEREKEEVVDREREGSRRTVAGLEAQLQAKSKQVDELQQGMLKVSHGIADLNKELQQTRDSHQKETDALREKHTADLQEVTKKNILEVELETDRVRTELQQRLDEWEAELQRLQEELQKSQSQLVQAQEEKERATEALQKEFCREKEELTESLKARHRQAIAELQTTFTQEERRKLESTQREHSERKDAEMQKRLQEVEATFEKRMQEKEDELFSKHSAQLESIESEWSMKLSAKESELHKEFEAKLEKTKEELQVRCAHPEVSEQAIQSGGGEVILLEQHQELLQAAETGSREEVTQRFEKLLAEEREERDKALRAMEEQHQRDKEDALHSLKTKVAAERQIQFNEAITRAVQQKDMLIAELRDQADKLTSANGSDGESKEQAQGIRKELEDIKEKESHLKGEKRRLEDEVSLLQRQLRQYSEQLHSMTASTMPISPSLVTDSTYQQTGGLDEGGSRPDWEQVAIVREQKINDLETKLMGMSMTTSIRREIRDKVSILTCNVGDLVLLCLDERHDQYVVFTVGSTLHFLHSDCLEVLGLKSAEGEPRKNWVLAEVTEREYCQARKAQNRFKVPVNTKFYRVKAKAWSPVGSLSSGGAAAAVTPDSPPSTPPPSSS
ncbi:RB1-inducible coiled-coil protein 1-like isoform X2 [Littorina saxatilis]|uniref:RB1-inducible coiled-coil protein 1 n=1 Tax=Littorina saxatilis TaxID=31220 RepID=A0AAN9G992_9CAEN